MLVETKRLAAAIVCAGGLIMPAIVSWPLPLFARAQVPPLSASVTVRVGPVTEPAVPFVEPVAEQFDQPAPVRVIVGLSGIEKPAANPMITLPPARRAPLALEVNPTVQVERALPVWGEPAKLTAVGVVAAAIVTLAPGLA